MTEEQYAKIQARLERLESKKKDIWDIIQILGTLLIPVAIAFAGNQYSKAQQAEALQVEQLQIERSHEMAQVNARIGQAGLIASMLDHLLSSDVKRKQLATEAVLIANPEIGPTLVRIVSEKDNNLEVRNFAKNALDERKNSLVQGLFDEKPAKRSEAYTGLMAGWSSNSEIIPEIITYARQHQANVDGVNNVLIFLSHMNQDALMPYKTEIETFIGEVQSMGQKTKERGAKLKNRLPK
ncbi:hypothetical protein [Adhaeribacter pallidiroseus]|uniref:HEAT repeat domain-containing protein n=1 Tax=Adhaeribacter pallidiroseus TaxID=2072847 RepID=A0A369QTP7_9BACT|nr:hypothetical protein [Adhaeribacter pallidiroseus]RDC65528.1 hypothetical protein AHMF7616_04158 [Adhaeribacter pallidiroseus]